MSVLIWSFVFALKATLIIAAIVALGVLFSGPGHQGGSDADS